VPTRLAFLSSCDPVPRERLPKGERWLFEVKLDGYRVQLHKAGRDVAIFSRNGHDWTARFPQLAGALQSLPRSAVIDCELVAAEGEGLAPFGRLHALVNRRREDGLVVFAFDLLAHGGHDLRALPYGERKRRLARLVARARIGRLLHSDSFHDGPRLLKECERRGLEGVVAKRRDAPYRAGASGDWLKIKTSAWKAANRQRHVLFDRRR
jgi:bifunctional non-homologous end joining protein LigD